MKLYVALEQIDNGWGEPTSNIIGIFSTEEMARAVLPEIDTRGSMWTPSIEEYNLDDMVSGCLKVYSHDPR